MRLGSFWPPQRAKMRIASEYYQWRNVGVPWCNRDAIGLLTDLLRSTDQCLEWGSGRSTAWIGRRVGTIRSVEHDPVWFERVQSQLASERLDSATVELLSLEPEAEPEFAPYVRAIDRFEQGGLDVCIVDGEHRVACLRAAVPKLASGGVLVLDDAQAWLDHPTASPHSRAGRGPADADWAGFVESVSGWRMMWTSDGYSDTAFWIKP